jgi:hypothetical protein
MVLIKYYLGDYIKKDGICGAGSTYGEEKRQACSFNVEKPGGKRLLGKIWRRCEDNIRMDSKEDEWAWAGFIWFKTGASGGMLRIR